MLSVAELVSSAPDWSTTVTRDGTRSGTLDAIKWTTACTCPSSRRRPENSFSITDALGSRFWRRNTDCGGSARCTRADSTGCMLPIVRASSVSTARTYKAFSMNGVCPNVLRSGISSTPKPAPCGSPELASCIRTSYLRSDGTSNPLPSSLYGTFAASSCAVISPISRSLKPE